MSATSRHCHLSTTASPSSTLPTRSNKFAPGESECLRLRDLSLSVFARRVETAANGSAEIVACLLCFEDKPKHLLRQACGRNGCDTLCCSDCLKGWYGALRPGELLTPTHLDCPFCKRAPTAKCLRVHNERGCELVRIARLPAAC